MAVVSGTPAEAIGMPRPALPMPACDALCLLLLACTEMMDQYKTCASDIFYEFKVQNRPSVLPPHGINGGNAATGGQVKHFDESNFRGALPGADGEETYGEVDDDYDENAPPRRSPSPRCMSLRVIVSPSTQPSLRRTLEAATLSPQH